MNEQLTNLLPLERQKALRRNYRLRLLTVGVLLATVLVGATAVLLIPTYVFLAQNEAQKRVALENVEASSSSADVKQLSLRLVVISNNAKVLAALAHTTSVSTLVSSVLAVSRPGITLSGFVYSPATATKGTAKKTSGTVDVSGTAATRDALHSYQLALQSMPSVAAATLPVSAYAQSSDIPFTITLLLAL